jgi:hypothetical protein
MKSSLDRTLALLRSQRQETADQPYLEHIYSPYGAIHLAARPRRRGWARVGLWMVIGLAGALLCFFLISGGRKAAPTISIVTPSHGSTVPAGRVLVSVQATNGKLGDDHLHYYLDVVPPTTPGKLATTAAGTWASTAATSYTWKDVAPGTHTLSVQLVRSDDTPFTPPVTAGVTVRVVSASPAPSPSRSPKPLPPATGS